MPGAGWRRLASAAGPACRWKEWARRAAGAMAPSAMSFEPSAAAAAVAVAGKGAAAATACALGMAASAPPSLQPPAALPVGVHDSLASSMSESSSASSLDSLAQLTPGDVPPAALGDALEGAAAAEPPSPTVAGQRFAYATLLTRDGYLPGVQALARSLQAVGSRHPLLVIYTGDTLSSAAVAALEAEPGCQPLAVERYVPPGRHDFGAYKLQLYAECWTKLRLWGLEQYERLVYLDADMIVLRNIDALFALPPGFYAAPDCTAGRKSQAERDGCPLFFPHQRRYFNAGFFVMSPSAAELARFGALLAAGAVPICGYAEQDFLNAVYQARLVGVHACWPGLCCVDLLARHGSIGNHFVAPPARAATPPLQESWQQLPHTFNCQKGIKHHHPQLWQERWDEVAILHYTDAKPWQREHPEHEQHRELVQLWWRVFERQPVATKLAVLPMEA
ncbi:hypothetical protein ABPG75_012545 [Micractinium tetrahymenae]